MRRVQRRTSSPPAGRAALGRALAAAVVVLLATALVACGGGDDGDGAPGSEQRVALLDTTLVERDIEASIREQRGIEADVSCPAEIAQREGATFNCIAEVPGDEVGTLFVVTQEADGFVRYVAR